MRSPDDKPFNRNYWGRLSQFEIPHSIVQGDVLILKPDALAVLLVLFEVGKAQQRTRSLGIGAKDGTCNRPVRDSDLLGAKRKSEGCKEHEEPKEDAHREPL
jgi:hypothetical protein